MTEYPCLFQIHKDGKLHTQIFCRSSAQAHHILRIAELMQTILTDPTARAITYGVYANPNNDTPPSRIAVRKIINPNRHNK